MSSQANVERLNPLTARIRRMGVAIAWLPVGLCMGRRSLFLEEGSYLHYGISDFRNRRAKLIRRAFELCRPIVKLPGLLQTNEVIVEPCLFALLIRHLPPANVKAMFCSESADALADEMRETV